MMATANRALGLASAIDRLTGWIGKVVSWLVLVMVVMSAFNAVARYLGRFLGVNLSSNAYLEGQWYLFSLVFLLGGAYALQKDSHVRVDVLFGQFPERVRRWINIVGTLVLLIPFSVFALVTAWPVVRNSWRIREASPDPGGLPRWPLKPFILVCFLLLLVQAVSELIKEIHALRHPEAAAHGYAEHKAEGV
jgi:TRAP-type mannitol/chloroaromatic compound transport system permease small subunit